MDRFDFSPLFRSTIGFDRLTRLVDAATRVDTASLAYPPYNIEKTGEDAYRLTMAVAGFSQDELEITAQENTLLVTGKAKKAEDENRYCIAESHAAGSSGASASPTTSRSSARASSTACCMSTWSGRFRRRRSRAKSRSAPDSPSRCLRRNRRKLASFKLPDQCDLE